MAENSSVNATVSSLNIKLGADNTATEKINQLAASLNSLKSLSNFSKDLSNAAKSLKEFAETTSKIQNLGKAFNDIASGIRAIESASRSGFNSTNIQKSVTSMSQLNDVMDEYRKRYEKINGQKVGVVGERNIKNAKNAMESLGDVKVLQKFQESIGQISSGSALRNLLRIPEGIQEGYGNIGSFGETVAEQYSISINGIERFDDSYVRLLERMAEYRDATNSMQFHGKDLFYYLIQNTDEAEKELIGLNGTFEDFQANLRGLSINKSSIFDYSSTLGLDTATMENGFDDYIKEVHEYQEAFPKAQQEQEAFFNALREQGAEGNIGFMTATLQQLEAVVDQFPQAQKYIDIIKKDLVEITDTEQQQSSAQPFEGLAKSLREINAAASEITSENAENISMLGLAMSSLGGLAGVKDFTVPDSLINFIKEMASIGQVRMPDNLGESIGSLSQLPEISEKLSEFEGTAVKMPDIGKSFSSIASGVNEIGKISNIGTIAILSQNLRNLNEATKELTSENARNVKAFGQGLNGIKNFKNFDLPENLDEKMNNILRAVEGITPDISKRVKEFGMGLNYLKSISDISLGEEQGSNIAAFVGKVGSVNAESAENLKKLASAIKNLVAIKDFNLPEHFSASVVEMANAFNILSNVDLKGVTSFSRAMNNLTKVKDFSLPTNMTSDIESLASSMELLTVETTSGLTVFASSIAQLSRIKEIDFEYFETQIERIPDIMDKIASIDMSHFTNQMLDLANAIGPLAEKLKDLEQGASAIQGNIRINVGTKSAKGTGKGKSATTGEEKQDYGAGAVTRSMEDLLKTLPNLAKQLEWIKQNAKDAIPTMLGAAAEKATGGINSLTEAVKNSSGAFDLLKRIGAPAINSVSEALTALESAHPIVYAIVQALRLLIATVKLVANVLKNEFQADMEYVKPILDSVKRKVEEFGNSLKSLPRRGLNTATDGIKSLAGSIKDSFTSPFKKATGIVTNFISGLKRIAYYRFIRTVLKEISDGFKEGADNLYQYSKLMGTDFATSMDSIATSLQYLKNSLGAMAAPLINALAPAIDFIIDKFVALLNVIGKVMAVLTGKSVYTQAKKQAAEYAEAAGGASKATQKFLLGIDEINKVDDPSGGGGGGGADYGDMFEEVEIGDDLDWAKRMKEAIDNGDWMGAGKILADHLNEVVDAWDADGWGRALADKINHGLEFAYGFLKNFDFVNLGKKVAEFLGGFNDQLNWELLGRTIAAGYNGLFDFIYGFATNLPWKSIGSNIALAINSFVDEFDATRAAEAISALFVGLYDLINTVITEIKWENIGAKLSEFLNNIDWYGIFVGVFSAIANGLNALKNLINGFLFGNGESGGFEWEKTARQIRIAIEEAWNKVEWAELGTALGNLIKTGLSFAAEVLSNEKFWYKLGSDIAKFFINLDWPGIFMGLSKVLVNAINAAIAAISGMTTEFRYNAQQIGDGIADAISYFVENANTDELADALNTFVTVALHTAGNVIDKLRNDGTLEELGQKIVSFFDKLDLGGMKSDLADLIGNWIRAKVSDIDVDGIMRSVGMNLIGGLVEGVQRKYEEIGFWGIIGMVFESMWKGILEYFGIHSPSQKMKEEVGFNLIEGLKEGISEKWESIVDFFSDAWENLKTSVSEGWENIKTVILDKLGPIGDLIEGIWGDSTKESKKDLDKYKKNVDTTFSESSKSVTLSMNEVNRISNENWQSVLTNTSDTLEKVQTNATTTFGAVFTTADSNLSQLNTSATTNFAEISKTVDTEFGNAASKAKTHSETLKTDSQKEFEQAKTGLDGTCKEIAKNTDTEFGNAKDNAVKRSVETDTEAGKAWDTIKGTLDGKMVDINKGADTRFDEVKGTINGKWDDTNTDAESKWKTITETLKTKWEGIKTAAKSIFEGFGTWLSGVMSNINTDMEEAGKEAAKSYQKGASSVDTTIKVTTNYLEHSSRNGPRKYATGTRGAAKGWAWVGEEGPELVNFGGGETVIPATLSARIASQSDELMESIMPSSTALKKTYSYMNEVMETLATSIEDSIPRIENAFKGVSETIQESIQTAFPDDIELPVSVESDVSKFAGVGYAEMDEQEARRMSEMDRSVQYEMTEKFTAGMRESNDNMVNVVYTAAQQIVNAINENGGDVYMDGNLVGRKTTEIQNRQNRMYGTIL